MPTLTGRFDTAFLYAHEAHATHQRKGSGTPYLGHLMGVASIVIDDGGGEEEAIAALLHDAAEDSGGRARLDDIRGRFGDQVAKIVEDCNRRMDRSKAGMAAPDPTRMSPLSWPPSRSRRASSRTATSSAIRTRRSW